MQSLRTILLIFYRHEGSKVEGWEDSMSDSDNAATAFLWLAHTLDQIYTRLVTTVQVLYLLELCCLG